jgi:hypothetical protein
MRRVGTVDLGDHVRGFGGATLQRLHEGPHRAELLVAIGALADQIVDALFEGEPSGDLGGFTDQSRENAAENGDIEFRRVGKMLEHGASRYTGHLCDVAYDRRDLPCCGKGKSGDDDGFACTRDAIAATGIL